MMAVTEPPARTPEQEATLTYLAEVFTTGRRWLCAVTHTCIFLGMLIGVLAAGWDHLLSAADHALHLIRGGK